MALKRTISLPIKPKIPKSVVAPQHRCVGHVAESGETEAFSDQRRETAGMAGRGRPEMRGPKRMVPDQ
jgi:hypothetical protein